MSVAHAFSIPAREKRGIWLAFLCVLLLPGCARASAASEPGYETCIAEIEDHPREVHRSAACIEAAMNGHAEILFALAVSFGEAGNREMERYYYRSAAEREYAPAYLALGHWQLRQAEADIHSAIDWYEKYVASGSEDYGYAALLASFLYLQLGDLERANRWRAICETSAYENCR